MKENPAPTTPLHTPVITYKEPISLWLVENNQRIIYTMLVWIFLKILIVIFILMAIAFYTLIEQKILSLTQNRLGPNKFSFQGILQPLLDGVKLIFKENLKLIKIFIKKPLFFSIILFILIAQIWFLIPNKTNNITTIYRTLLILILLSIMSYSILIIGITTKSKFGRLGRIRASAQTIRYEIRLAFILLSPLILWTTLSIKRIKLWLNPRILLFIFWWITCLAECNRAPFDFAEGERELIRGFNIEYSSRNFIFIFLAEYGIILVFSLITTSLYFNKRHLIFILLITSFLTIRRTYPRFRYDMLIKLCWTLILPLSILIFFFFIIIK